MEELKIVEVAIEELKPADYNPRKWSEEARRGLTASIDEFGFIQPIVANSAPNRRGVVIGGNFKLDIAKEKGRKTVPVVWVNLPDIKKEKELNLRLNKNQGEFDYDLLVEFDLKMLSDVGFDAKDIDKIFKNDDEDDFDGDKEAGKIEKPESKLGDVYELGRHRLMCGNSSSAEDVAKLLGGGGNPSRYGIYRPAIQRQLFGAGQEYEHHHRERQYGRVGLPPNAQGVVRELLQPPETKRRAIHLLRIKDAQRI